MYNATHLIMIFLRRFWLLSYTQHKIVKEVLAYLYLLIFFCKFWFARIQLFHSAIFSKTIVIVSFEPRNFIPYLDSKNKYIGR